MAFRDAGPGCPVCAISLVEMSVRGRDCRRCPSCGGIWIPSQAFHELLAETAGSGPQPELQLVHRTSGRACPDCRDPMASLVLEHVEIEQCQRHGIWLDRNELQEAFLMASEPRWTWTRRDQS